MSRDLFSRYAWIVDTITRYGKISRADINRLWRRSHLSDGQDIPERTFFNYRRAIEENFHIDILCNPRGEYYISDDRSVRRRAFTNWLLDSRVVSSAMSEGGDVAAMVSVEDVPSAREWLPLALDAVRNKVRVEFTYAGFNRSRPEKDILFEPYMLKRYKQRWYMIGRRVRDGGVRTYALDRVKSMHMVSESFEVPEDFDPSDLFDNIIGMTISRAEVRTVRLKVNTTQAKYFRALPFHHSQTEDVGDGYSVFSYRLKLNYELVHEILALGSNVKVLEPKELEVMVTQELRDALEQY